MSAFYVFCSIWNALPHNFLCKGNYVAVLFSLHLSCTCSTMLNSDFSVHAFCAFVLLVPTFLCTLNDTGCNGQCSMSTCLLQSLLAGSHFHLPTMLA